MICKKETNHIRKMLSNDLFNSIRFMLGYTLPKNWTKYVGIDRTRLYISGSDLFCISNYPKGWDPEMGTSAYPITTSLVVGVQVNF